MREEGVERNLRRKAEELEATGAHGRHAGRQPRSREIAQDQQRALAERDGRTGKENHHHQIGSGAAPGAVRYSLTGGRMVSAKMRREKGVRVIDTGVPATARSVRETIRQLREERSQHCAGKSSFRTPAAEARVNTNANRSGKPLRTQKRVDSD